MIVLFAVRGLDPVTNLFAWFSGLAVVAIVVVEVLGLHRRRRRTSGGRGRTPGSGTRSVAPILAALGLLIGLYLLMSRFGLLAGTVAEGVDPTTQAWGLNTTGWVLVLLPFAVAPRRAWPSAPSGAATRTRTPCEDLVS